MQIYNLRRCGYYPEEITDRVNTWTLIEEIHSFYYEEKCFWLFLVVTESSWQYSFKNYDKCYF